MGLNTCAKDTFWNRLRQQRGVTLKAVSVALDMDRAKLSHYFTGQELPSTAKSVKICDYFGIDYAVGASEFNKAHEEWVANNPGSKKKRSRIRSRRFDVNSIPAESSPVPGISPKFVEPVPQITLVERIPETLRTNVLRTIYDKVDFDTYNKVAKIFDS